MGDCFAQLSYKLLTCRLNLKIEGPIDHALTNKTFQLLGDFLQPDTALTLESTAQLILDLLPEKAPQSTEIWSFGETCIEIAEQISYHHPSHIKLAALLEYLAKSTKLGQIDTSKVRYFEIFRHPRCRLSLTIARVRMRASMSSTNAWESPSGIH